MDPRRTIPTIALLGLSLTDCGGKEEPSIVGTWTAIEVDMEKFPMVEKGEDYVAHYGYELQVDDDLSGDFGYYSVLENGGVNLRSEQKFAVAVDDADAPHFVITVDYAAYVGYADGGYERSLDPAGSVAGLLATALRSATRGPEGLGAAVRPSAAEGEMTLDCQLAGDNLDCTLHIGGEGEVVAFRFARKEGT